MSTPVAHPKRARDRRPWAWLVGIAVVLATAWLFWPQSPTPVVSKGTSLAITDPSTIERGRYLSVVGNCQGCHTPQGGLAFAGGRRVPTPFGAVYGSNLTPSPTGLAAWSADDFWRALHHGQSRDGRWLSPAFPYPNTTHITRTDSDALFAYLRSLPAVDRPNTPSELRWPYNTQAALRVWRALYFRPSAESGDAPDDTPLNRGAYLVNGLAHCSACHTARNALGGSSDMLGLAGGLIPMQNWTAPSLLDPDQAGLQDWSEAAIVALFQSGVSGERIVTGPMAEVVQNSTQHWSDTDLNALAVYLRQLPRTNAPPRVTVHATREPARDRGAQTYENHCAACHGQRGEGVSLANGLWAYPPLVDNATLRLSSPANLIQTVLHGGFAPSTRAQPRPFGMPPFVMDFSNQELADLATFLRQTWGRGAGPVSALDVQKLRDSTER